MVRDWRDHLQNESSALPPSSCSSRRPLWTTAPKGGAELDRMELKTSLRWTSDVNSFARPNCKGNHVENIKFPTQAKGEV